MLTAIYYPKLKRLTYWYPYGTGITQAKVDQITLDQAKDILEESMVKSELIQSLEIFRSK